MSNHTSWMRVDSLPETEPLPLWQEEGTEWDDVARAVTVVLRGMDFPLVAPKDALLMDVQCVPVVLAQDRDVTAMLVTCRLCEEMGGEELVRECLVRGEREPVLWTEGRP